MKQISDMCIYLVTHLPSNRKDCSYYTRYPTANIKVLRYHVSMQTLFESVRSYGRTGVALTASSLSPSNNFALKITSF